MKTENVTPRTPPILIETKKPVSFFDTKIFTVDLFEKTASAGVGALINSLVVTPLDVVKVRMQAQQKLLPSFHGKFDSRTSYVFCSQFFDRVEPCSCHPWFPNPTTTADRPTLASRIPINGTWDGMVKISRYEGISNLWRGLSPTLLMSIPATVVYYVGYDALKDALKFSLPSLTSRTENIIHPIIAGSTARIAAVSLISPIELLKTKMQHRGPDGGIINIGREMIRAVRLKGPTILYKGLVPTLWRDVPFSAIYWTGYENFRKFFQRKIQITLNDSAINSFRVSFLAGATSGMIAALLTTPFDVAKTRQQIELIKTHHIKKSIIQHLREIWINEGILGLTRGIIPRVCKVAPSCAIMVGTYEFGKVFLLENRHSSF